MRYDCHTVRRKLYLDYYSRRNNIESSLFIFSPLIPLFHQPAFDPEWAKGTSSKIS